MSFKITVNRGDVYRRTIVVRVKGTETPIDITGCTIRFTVRDNEELFDITSLTDDNSAIIAKVISPSAPEDGELELFLSSGETNLEPRRYKCDFQIRFAGGDIISRVGDFIVCAEVTRTVS